MLYVKQNEEHVPGCHHEHYSVKQGTYLSISLEG